MVANAMLRCQGDNFINHLSEKLYPYALAERVVEQSDRGEERRGVAKPLIYRTRVPNCQHLSLILVYRRLREVLLRIAVIDDLGSLAVAPAQLVCPNRRDRHQRRGISYHRPFEHGVDRPAPTRLPEAVIWIV